MTSRRELLVGLSSVGVAWAAVRAGAADTSRLQPSHAVDVHAHYYPPALKALGTPSLMNTWSVQRHLEDMDAAGVARTLLSLTTPGIVATGDQGRALTRESNEFAAKTCAE